MESLHSMYGLESEYRDVCGNRLEQEALFKYRYGMFKVNALIHRNLTQPRIQRNVKTLNQVPDIDI
jgi:hypothetical protein